MKEIDLERLKVLRHFFDRALLICDPIAYAGRQQDLLHAIAEYLIRPLQEHELAEKSQLRHQESDIENVNEGDDHFD